MKNIQIRSVYPKNRPGINIIKRQTIYRKKRYSDSRWISYPKGYETWQGWLRKARNVLKHIKDTNNMNPTLSAESLSVIQWWVDASDLTHHSFKRNTGAMIQFIKEAVVSLSRKQKINVRSSMESELLGVANYLPMMLWCKYLTEYQGYTA